MSGTRSRAMVPISWGLVLSLLVSCGGGGGDSSGNSSNTTGSSANDVTGGVLGSKCDKPGDTRTVNGVDLMCDKPDGKNPVWVTNPNSSGGVGSDPSSAGGDPSKDGENKGDYPSSKDAPPCPADLEGILTSQMFNPDDLLFITPLGNVTPPGHTAPIDHQYITPSHAGPIPLYAPADGWVARMQTGGYSDDGGQTLKLEGFVFTLVICQGLVLETTGNANMEDLNPAIRALLPTDPASQPANGACKFGINKMGHAHQDEWACTFQDLSLKVTAGDLLATLTSVAKSDTFDFGVETWLADYNVDPPDNGIHWDWYADNRYVHSICLFDKFSADLNAGYVAKLGGVNPLAVKGDKGIFYRQQAMENDPLCGVTVQDTPGTLLGYWFGAPDTQSKFGDSGPQYGDNSGISFIRNNVNPDAAEVVEGGGLVPGSAVISFVPQHNGSIDRDPVEVTPGSTVYCYNAPGQIVEANGGNIIPGDHRFVVQLVDATQTKVDLQSGSCTGSESLTAAAITYVR